MGESRLSVTGMACDGCEQTVEEALESVEGVAEATADHTRDTVEVITAEDVDDDALRKAVADAGYEVAG